MVEEEYIISNIYGTPAFDEDMVLETAPLF